MKLIQNIKLVCPPFKNLVIDKRLILWKGRLNFKQFIETKFHHFDIKMFILCDCKTDFILKFIIYTSSTTKLNPCNFEISGSAVNTLIKSYLGKGHNLFIDN